jgi:hypothetical protein
MSHVRVIRQLFNAEQFMKLLAEETLMSRDLFDEIDEPQTIELMFTFRGDTPVSVRCEVTLIGRGPATTGGTDQDQQP